MHLQSDCRFPIRLRDYRCSEVRSAYSSECDGDYLLDSDVYLYEEPEEEYPDSYTGAQESGRSGVITYEQYVQLANAQ